MSHELGARAIVILHENGQVLHRYGWVNESDYPVMAALISAMIATGKSLGQLGENFPGAPSRFACDSEEMGLYIVCISPGIWISVLYEQPLNPGQFRMKVRRYSSLFAKLGIGTPTQWEKPASERKAEGVLAPSSRSSASVPEKITVENSSLFADITDEEIDNIFENPSS